jgi:hypothetical protein
VASMQHLPGNHAGVSMIDLPNSPNLHGLVELGNRTGVDIRPTLLRVVTDLYVQKPKHTEAEERQFTALALRLIESVDAPTRAIVAEKLAAYPMAPAAVRQRLMRNHVLPETQEAAKPITNESITGAQASADELSELFFFASAEERRLILLNLQYAPVAPATPIAAELARESIYRLEAAALGRNREAFAQELEHILSISRAQARRLIADESGEPIVVVAAALGMQNTVLQRILLCLNPAIGQSVQRVYELAQLQLEIEPEAALRLVAIWQARHKTDKPPAAAHRPVYSPAEPPVRTETTSRPKSDWENYPLNKAERA